STSATGLSDAYDYFCVASEGYKELFIRKGVKKEKLIATGIPNFDDAARHLNNDFPHKHYVLAATSDTRETFKYENRKKFIRHVLDIADGRKVIFKLHPNENVTRATEEINKYAPEAVVYSNGNTNHMIANCDVLITRFSSVVYIGIALGKEVHSEFNLDELKRMTPIQNGGASACNIALLARKALANEKIETIEFNGEHTAADAEYEFAR
ncbi:MAG TPA: CDP-glycerol glycerophosphotransferase family protein, partial [Ignavibacteriales bacterium]|nr:CDP-glycerol glycerophosphotransferase family protein [Ignavibacteriales bacterium]